MSEKLLPRIPIIEVFPVIEDGTLPAKATEGEPFPIRATVFREGHDAFAAEAVLLRPDGGEYSRTRMVDIAPGLDRYEAWVAADTPGAWSLPHRVLVRPLRHLAPRRRRQSRRRHRRRAHARGGRPPHGTRGRRHRLPQPDPARAPGLGHRGALRRCAPSARHQSTPRRRAPRRRPVGLASSDLVLDAISRCATTSRPLAPSTHSRWTASKRAGRRPGTKSSRARWQVAYQNPDGTWHSGTLRSAPPSELRRASRPWASTSSTSPPSPPSALTNRKGQQQHPNRAPRRPRLPLRHRLPRRRPRRHPPRPGRPSTTSTALVAARREAWAWRSPWTWPSSAPRTTRG